MEKYYAPLLMMLCGLLCVVFKFNRYENTKSVALDFIEKSNAIKGWLGILMGIWGIILLLYRTFK